MKKTHTLVRNPNIRGSADLHIDPKTTLGHVIDDDNDDDNDRSRLSCKFCFLIREKCDADLHI